MGWQDRDWAKWTDDERARFLGHSPSVTGGAFLAVVVSLVATVLLAGAPGVGLLHRHKSPMPPVYGTGTVIVAMGHDATCTQLLDGVCNAYTVVEPGQRVHPAAPLPPGTSCPLHEVDQARGVWFCAPPGPTENS